MSSSKNFIPFKQVFYNTTSLTDTNQSGFIFETCPIKIFKINKIKVTMTLSPRNNSLLSPIFLIGINNYKRPIPHRIFLCKLINKLKKDFNIEFKIFSVFKPNNTIYGMPALGLIKLQSDQDIKKLRFYEFI